LVDSAGLVTNAGSFFALVGEEKWSRKSGSLEVSDAGNVPVTIKECTGAEVEALMATAGAKVAPSIPMESARAGRKRRVTHAEYSPFTE
jgi:hypothetical protein